MFCGMVARYFWHVKKGRNCMSVLFILIGFSLVLAVGFLFAFIISVKSGQYDDEYTPSVRILFDDKPTTSSSPKAKS